MATFAAMVSRYIRYAPFYLLSLLPLRILYVFSDMAMWVMYRVLGYRRRVVYRNVRGSFPAMSALETQQTCRAFYHHFCDMWVEAVKTLTIGKKNMSSRFRILNPELMNSYHDRGLSVILFASHTGNWELFNSLPLTVPHRVLAFYQPLSNRYFDGLIKAIRQRFGVEAIDSRHGYKTLADYAGKGVLTCSLLLGDQSPGRTSGRQWIRFLNRETAFITGADRIAARTGQVVMFPRITRVRRGYYELEYRVIEEDSRAADPATILKRYAGMLEEAITASPHMWLWSHRRWKIRKEPAKQDGA